MKPSGSNRGGFRKILVAVDGSKYGNRATLAASVLARQYGSKLIVLHAVAIPGYVFATQPGMPAVDLSQYGQYAKKEAEAVVDNAVRLAAEQGAEAAGEVLENVTSAVEAIVDFAQNENVELIVIGTRGLTGFKKMMLGSVSSGVVSHAHCSVLVVR